MNYRYDGPPTILHSLRADLAYRTIPSFCTRSGETKASGVRVGCFSLSRRSHQFSYTKPPRVNVRSDSPRLVIFASAEMLISTIWVLGAD